MKYFLATIFLFLTGCQALDNYNNYANSPEGRNFFGRLSAGEGYGQARANDATPPNSSPRTSGATCPYIGEQESDFKTICYYDCPSGMTAITISAARRCPASIKG